jgi:hypothetical protein
MVTGKSLESSFHLYQTFVEGEIYFLCITTLNRTYIGYLHSKV